MPFKITCLLLLAGSLAAQGHSDAAAPASTAVGKPVSLLASGGLQAAKVGDGLVGGGARYRARFDRRGMRFEPALGTAVETTRHLTLTPIAVRRGADAVLEPSARVAPAAVGRAAVYAHAPGITERYEVRGDGVELSWRFARRPPGEGDLVVQYALDTDLPPASVEGGDRGVDFALAEIGGVRIGGVTGIAADGRTVRGGVHYENGVLELSLPAEFVSRAAYPLVLDPIIGGIFGVITTGNDDGEPDAAYDSTADMFLVVWQRTFSATDSAVRGQRVASDGSLVGGTVFFGSGGLASRPRVAFSRTRQRWGVVWTQFDFGTRSVMFEAVSDNGAVTHSLVVASSATSDFSDADIGSQVDAPFFTLGAFVVIYRDLALGAIRARRIGFNVLMQLIFSIPFTVLADQPFGSSYSQPAISRTASGDSLLMVVARQETTLSLDAIVAVALDAETGTLGPSGTVYANLADDVEDPDVDGFAGRWVVAWRQATGGSALPAVARRPVSLDPGGTGFVAGPVATLGGSLVGTASSPSVGYTPGRTWLGYRFTLLSLGVTPSVRVLGVDSGSCVSCNDSFSAPVTNQDTRIVVATMAAGGLTSGEDALAVWGDGGDVLAQRLRNHAQAGAIVDVGGGCGTGGTQSFSHDPGIGSSGLVCTVDGLSPTALVTVFNFASPGAAIPCGACVWSPFSVTQTPPIVAGSASVEFPIPCVPALAGSLFETQWTTIDLATTPCPLLPGFALSQRLFVTIGQ